MEKINFDLYLEEELRDPQFAERFQQAGEAWDRALQRTAQREQSDLPPLPSEHGLPACAANAASRPLLFRLGLPGPTDDAAASDDDVRFAKDS